MTIVGGEGNFGRFIGENLKGKIPNIYTLGSKSTDSEIEEKLQKADVIIFSVSIRNTPCAIKSMSEKISGDKLVIDVSGFKKGSLEILSNLNVSEVISLHPMFGPFINSIEGKNIIEIDIKSGKRWKILRKLLIKAGAKITKMNADEHDRKMALIQALPHIMNMIFVMTLKKMGTHPNDISCFSTPIYKLQSLISGRFLNQSSSLYADMQIENSEFTHNVFPAIQESLTEMGLILNGGDYSGFEEIFENLGEFLGKDFLNQALVQSKKVDSIF